MNRTALATVHAIHPVERPPSPVPSAGVASVTVLATPLTHGLLTPVAEAQAELELLLYEPPEAQGRAQLRLVTREEGDLDRFAAVFAHSLVEVLAGDRGVHQLLRWTTEQVYDDLLRRSFVLQRAAANGQRTRRIRAQIRSVHLSRPHLDAAELSIHVRQGARSRAIAVRIDLVEGRWRCTALQFG